MKFAQVFKFKDRYIIVSQSKTTVGYRVSSEPYFTLSSNSTMGDVVDKLLVAIDASKQDVTPKDHDESLKEFLSEIGLKKHVDLYKESIMCSVYESDGNIHFQPTVNMGVKGGFRNRVDGMSVVSKTKDIESLAIALVEALSLCE